MIQMYRLVSRQVFGSQLRRNLTISSVTTLVNFAIAAISYPVYLHYLGYELYGTWLALSIIITLTQLGGLGIAPAVTKYVAEEWKSHDTTNASAIISSAYTIIFVTGTFTVLVLSIFRQPICALFELPRASHVIAVRLLPWIALLSVYTLISQVTVGALSGVGRADRSAMSQLAGRILNLAFASLLLSFHFRVEGLLYGTAIATLVSHILCEYWLFRYASIRWARKRAISVPNIKRLLGFGSGVFGSSVMQMLLTPLNRVLLARYAGVASLPIFEVAWGAAMQLRGLVSSAFQALLPDFSRAAAAHDERRIKGLKKNATRLMWLLSLPVYSTAFLLAQPALKLWLRDSFQFDQVSSFRVMLVGSFIGMLGVTPYYQLLGVGNVRDVFISQFIQSFTNVAAMFLFVWVARLTPLSASLSVSIGMVFCTIWLLIRTRKIRL